MPAGREFALAVGEIALGGAHIAHRGVAEKAIVDERLGALGGEHAAHARAEMPRPAGAVIERVEVEERGVLVAIRRLGDIEIPALLAVRLVEPQADVGGDDAFGLWLAQAEDVRVPRPGAAR